MLMFTFKGNLKKPVNGLSATQWRGLGGELVSLHNLQLSCFYYVSLTHRKNWREENQKNDVIKICEDLMPFDVIKSSKPLFYENCNWVKHFALGVDTLDFLLHVRGVASLLFLIWRVAPHPSAPHSPQDIWDRLRHPWVQNERWQKVNKCLSL